MDLFYWQLIFIVTVFLLAVCGSFWPLVALKWKLKQKEGSVVEDFKDSKAISLGNSLACGVFFGLCFLHLVPHSAHKWNEIFELSNHTMYEKRDEHHHHKNSNLLAPFLILFSFTIMLFFEKNELCCKQKSSENLPIIILTQVSCILRHKYTRKNTRTQPKTKTKITRKYCINFSQVFQKKNSQVIMNYQPH